MKDYPGYSKRRLFDHAVSLHEAQENAVRGFSRRNTSGGRYDGQRIGWRATKMILEDLIWAGEKRWGMSL